jgi:hypothetical protein
VAEVVQQLLPEDGVEPVPEEFEEAWGRRFFGGGKEGVGVSVLGGMDESWCFGWGRVFWGGERLLGGAGGRGGWRGT